MHHNLVPYLKSLSNGLKQMHLIIICLLQFEKVTISTSNPMFLKQLTDWLLMPQQKNQRCNASIRIMEASCQWGNWACCNYSCVYTTVTTVITTACTFLMTKVVKCPGITWTVQELTHSVQYPGKGRFGQGNLAKSHSTIKSVNKKAVLSQRWPLDAPTKINKRPHLHLRSCDSPLTQFNRTLWTYRCWTNIFTPKFLHVPLGVDGWPLSYEERRWWANCSCD